MSKVLFRTEGSLGIITLNNPPLNLFSQEMVDELMAILKELPGQNLRGLILNSSQRHFSAGADMSLFAGKDHQGGQEAVNAFLVGLIRSIEALPYPTLAAVRGVCLGGGFEIALACDLIWASNEAKFGNPEAKIGMIPLAAGSRMIAARAGIARAKEIVFEANMYNAEQLEKWDIVNRVVSDAEIEEQSLKYMKMLAEGATLAHAVTKELHREYYNEGPNRSDELLLEIVPPLFETKDFINGPCHHLGFL
jgi:enoyl-CoA hydratase/carnithine racemase